MIIFKAFRYRLTRLIYWAMGLNLNSFREEVERLWVMDESSRRAYLDQHLSEIRPKDSNGHKISNLVDLKRAPSMTKNNFSSLNRVTGGRFKDKFHRHTAGTTGQPTNIFLSKRELGRMLAVRDYCFHHHGIRLGDREARIWGRPQAGIKSRIKNFLLNRRVFHALGDGAGLELKQLANWKPNYIYGYPSLILQMAIKMSQSDIKPPKVTCIICTAETIQQSQKDYIAELFKAPVIEEYGSTEFDVIAFECSRGHRHIVNPWLVTEIENGTLVISDTSRESQSLIKYQQGDTATLKESHCTFLGSKFFIASLDGRDIDRLAVDYDGKKFHATEFAHIVDEYCEKNSDVLDFKIVQKAPGQFEVLVTDKPKNGIADLCQYMEVELEKRLKKRVSFTGKHCQFITLGQKRSYFQSMI